MSWLGPQSVTRAAGGTLAHSAISVSFTNFVRFRPARLTKWALALVVSSPVPSMAASCERALSVARPMQAITPSMSASTSGRSANAWGGGEARHAPQPQRLAHGGHQDQQLFAPSVRASQVGLHDQAGEELGLGVLLGALLVRVVGAVAARQPQREPGDVPEILVARLINRQAEQPDRSLLLGHAALHDQASERLRWVLV